jgi:hypothetical protein
MAHVAATLRGCPSKPHEPIDIDVSLVPLVAELWRLSIATVESCEGRPGEPAWISFATVAGCEEFIWASASGYDAELNRYGCGHWADGKPSIELQLRVQFPLGDVPALVARFSRLARRPNGWLGGRG